MVITYLTFYIYEGVTFVCMLQVAAGCDQDVSDAGHGQRGHPGRLPRASDGARPQCPQDGAQPRADEPHRPRIDLYDGGFAQEHLRHLGRHPHLPREASHDQVHGHG